jgi:uncharacterized membrane protein YoaK (UPF0700 family)
MRRRVQDPEQRTRHIIFLAALLAATAGMVNAVGFFAFDTLVTNVTGHFARIAHEVVERQFASSLEHILWVSSFCAGAFFSTVLMLPAQRRGATFIFAPPIALEAAILLGCVLLGPRALQRGVLSSNVLTAGLLFAMGLQNATVTVISGAVVRTTHLTGTLTDIGINAGRWLFDSSDARRPALGRALSLHLTVTGCFVGGALVGGLAYYKLGFFTLFLPIGSLAVAWVYDEYFYHLELRQLALRSADLPGPT